MRRHTLYHVDRDMETKCFQLRNIYPGAAVRQKINDVIIDFIGKRPHIYNGGWAVHKYLESIDPKHKLYNESDICEMTDFDLFGVDVVSELVELGYALKKEIPQLSFTVNNGMHMNQFIIVVNFLGQKLVDWIHVPASIFAKLPTIRYANGDICVHPMIELLRHYYMLSNYFAIAPDKDINKVLKRIYLLEKLVMIKWLKDIQLWNKNDITKITLANQPSSVSFKQLDNYVVTQWFDMQKYVALINAPIISNETEYVVHDSKFNIVSSKLLSCLRKFCKEHNLPENAITVTTYEPFIGVIGPSYNGWLEINIDGIDATIRLYSHANPVHVYDATKRICSYFHSMSHWLWRILMQNTLETPNKQKKELLELQVATVFKNVKYDDKFYTVTLKHEFFIGPSLVKSIYMTNNVLRYKNINTLKITIDDKKSVPKSTYKYNEYEGKPILKKRLNKLDKNTVLELPSLYPSVPKNENNNKKSS